MRLRITKPEMGGGFATIPEADWPTWEAAGYTLFDKPATPARVEKEPEMPDQSFVASVYEKASKSIDKVSQQEMRKACEALGIDCAQKTKVELFFAMRDKVGVL